LRKVCVRYCKIAKRYAGDIVRLQKDKICDVFWNIGEDRKKNMGRMRRSKHQEMAGDSRENYDGRFAGISWREVCGENMEGKCDAQQ
jgi:hypothetical protein